MSTDSTLFVTAPISISGTKSLVSLNHQKFRGNDLCIRYKHGSPQSGSRLVMIAPTSTRSTMPNSGFGSKRERIASTRHPNLEIVRRTWDPEGGISAVQCGVIIIPGFQWHGGWFGNLANELTKSASARVVTLDLLSTGESDDINGVRGLTPDMRDHLDDLSVAVEQLNSDLNTSSSKNAPIYVLGESSGGITACLLALYHKQVNARVKGWILCAPALQIYDKWLPPRPIVYASRFISLLFPLLSSPRRVEKETMEAGVGDEALRKLAMEDPLVLYDVPFPLATMRARLNAMDIVDEAIEKGTLQMNSVLVLHNRNDPCAIYNASETFVRGIQTKTGIAELTDPGGNAHQLLQEKKDVVSNVVNRIVEFVTQDQL